MSSDGRVQFTDIDSDSGNRGRSEGIFIRPLVTINAFGAGAVTTGEMTRCLPLLLPPAVLAYPVAVILLFRSWRAKWQLYHIKSSSLLHRLTQRSHSLDFRLTAGNGAQRGLQHHSVSPFRRDLSQRQGE